MHRLLLILLVVAGCKKSKCEAAVDDFIEESDTSAASLEKLCPDLDEAALSCIVRARDYPSASYCVLNAKLAEMRIDPSWDTKASREDGAQAAIPLRKAGPTTAPSKLRLCDEAIARYRELTRNELDRSSLISQCEEKGVDAFECVRKAESPAAARSCLN